MERVHNSLPKASFRYVKRNSRDSKKPANVVKIDALVDFLFYKSSPWIV